MDERFLRQAELHLRLHLHALVPLHEGVVDAMCAARMPPLELATALEDIGQRYLKMAEVLNGEVIRRDMLDAEPEAAEDLAEARIADFTAALLAQAAVVVLADGTRIDARSALEASPVVGDAIKSAVLLSRGRRPPTLRRVT